MTKTWHIIYVSLIVLLVVLLINPRESAGMKPTINIPAVEGVFKADSIKPIENSKKKKVVYQKDTIVVPEALNEDLLLKYAQAQDSIERLNLYVDMIQTRKYFKNFKDDNINIDLEMNVTGKLEDVKLEYQTFQKSIEVPRNPVIIRGGLDMQVYDKFVITPKVSIEDRKGKIYSIGVREDYFSIGVEAPLIKFK